jgi:hypothetical protein
MSNDSESIRSRIDKIAGEIAAERGGRSKPWSGADIVLSETPPKQSDNPSFYPDKRHIVTPFAWELNWLFVSLRNIFGANVDFKNKLAFYERLADAADRYLAGNSRVSHTSKALLAAVTTEAGLMAEEFK